jgi:hypothetical protein
MPWRFYFWISCSIPKIPENSWKPLEDFNFKFLEIFIQTSFEVEIWHTYVSIDHSDVISLFHLTDQSVIQHLLGWSGCFLKGIFEGWLVPTYFFKMFSGFIILPDDLSSKIWKKSSSPTNKPDLQFFFSSNLKIFKCSLIWTFNFLTNFWWQLLSFNYTMNKNN